MRILVIEDDSLLGDAIQSGLREVGYAVDWIKDGIAADAAISAHGYSAVVLDLGLPRLSGLELLHRIRSRNDRTPVLILTARDGVEDRIKGLDTGADDYLAKPFDMGELAARLRAISRRASGQVESVVRLAGIELDPAAHRVVFRGQPVALSPREFALLEALMRRPGRVLTRAQLEQTLYAWGEEIESNAVEVHIHHLRRKLAPESIQTVRGVGYLIARDNDG